MLKLKPGDRFGRLTVVEFSHVDEKHFSRWKCVCDCGNEIVVRGANLTDGHTKSCGCWHKDFQKYTPTRTTHGGTNTKLYAAWCNMKERCYNPKHEYYYLYGERGISVCDEWLHDFSAFRNWSLENGYADGLTIDRIDNYKGYSPDNCRWTTWSVQNKNKRPREEWKKRC